MNFLQKLQSQPPVKKKIILWATTVVLGLGLLFWWIASFQQKIKSFEMKDLNLPSKCDTGELSSECNNIE